MKSGSFSEVCCNKEVKQFLSLTSHLPGIPGGYLPLLPATEHISFTALTGGTADILLLRSESRLAQTLREEKSQKQVSEGDNNCGEHPTSRSFIVRTRSKQQV